MQLLSSTKLAAELITCLQEIQERLGYISPQAITWLADKLHLSEQEVYGVASFYNDFRFSPPGKHQLRICLGTACHVKGAGNILSTLEDYLGIKRGETTEDMLFTLEAVRCIGCCGLAPVLKVGEDVHGLMTVKKIPQLIEMYRSS